MSHRDILAAGPSLVALAGEGADIEAAAAEGDAPRKFSAVAYTGAAMRVSAYGPPTVVDLAGMSVPRQDLPVLRGHDPGQIVGHTAAVEVTAQRVRASGLISGAGDAAAEVLATAGKGFPWQVSIGASADRVEYVDAGQTVKVNGRVFSGPLVVARATTLREISFVPLGADGATSANVAASLEGAGMFEQWLQAKGIDPATLTDPTRAVLQAAFDAEQKKPKPKEPGLEEVLAARRQEDDRLAGVARLVQAALDAGMPTDTAEPIGRMAVEGKWTAEATELALLRAARPTAPAYRSAPPAELDARVMEAALCRFAGLPNLEAAFDERTLEAADKRHRTLGLQEALYLLACRNGYRGSPGKGNIEDHLQYAFRPRAEVQASGPSTIGVSGILSNVANKFVVDSFNAVESEWRKVAATRPVGDFKEITSYALTGDLEYDEIAAGGKIKHGSLGEEEYGNRAKPYGKMLVIDFMALRNDDAGAFRQVGKKLGRGGALKFNTVFWTEFLKDYATWWTAARGNYDDGTDTAFSSSGLDAAMQIWDAKTDPDGKPLGATPTLLLTGPKFRIEARRLMNSTLIGANDSEGSSNPWAGMFTPVVSTYLANSAMGGGYSADAWYLLADPNDIPVIEACFLDGREVPEVQNFTLSEDQLGMGMRAVWSFGVRKQEYRGGLRLKGTA